MVGLIIGLIMTLGSPGLAYVLGWVAFPDNSLMEKVFSVALGVVVGIIGLFLIIKSSIKIAKYRKETKGMTEKQKIEYREAKKIQALKEAEEQKNKPVCANCYYYESGRCKLHTHNKWVSNADDSDGYYKSEGLRVRGVSSCGSFVHKYGSSARSISNREKGIPDDFQW